MLQRLQHARLIWPTLFALAGFAVLVGLGTWQVERKRWKEDLLGKIAARIKAEPVSVKEARRIVANDGDAEYLHVTASGVFHHDKERYFYSPAPGGLAWHVYTPMQLEGGGYVWVSRGVVPDAYKDPASRPEGQVSGPQRITGVVRVPGPKPFFAPENNVEGNLWYWPELEALTASAFRAGKVETVPFVIEADARPTPPGGLPRGGVTRIDLPNRHLEYALTWYGLALALVAVYFAFVFRRLRDIEA